MPNRRELGYVSAGSTSTVYVSTGIYGRATGGIGSPTAVTISGVNYEYLTFNSTGTLTVTTAGWFDYLAIGGGGGSIYISSIYANGGGGAGQVVVGSIYLSANQTITIGAGGSFYNYDTRFSQATATIVGATSPYNVGAVGNFVVSDPSAKSLAYVGGGVGSPNTQTSTGTENALVGYRGGDSSAQQNGGGGGGQSARGGNGSSTTGGTGGAGYNISAFIGGSATYKAQGGGGGGSVTGGTAATGGVAGSATTTPPNGGANTGQGGGGGYGVVTTGNGGSGICYIRWSVS
jgi:hypothetical protein